MTHFVFPSCASVSPSCASVTLSCTPVCMCVVDTEEAGGEEWGRPVVWDGRAEARKLFSQLKTSRHNLKKAEKPEGLWKDKRGVLGGPHFSGSSAPLQGAVLEVLKQLDAWRVIQDFCLQLPVFKHLQEDKAYLTVSGTDGTSGMNTLVER